MNKKFLSAILFGALMASSTGTFVSCKDYDDDIKDLQEELNKKATLEAPPPPPPPPAPAADEEKKKEEGKKVKNRKNKNTGKQKKILFSRKFCRILKITKSMRLQPKMYELGKMKCLHIVMRRISPIHHPT